MDEERIYNHRLRSVKRFVPFLESTIEQLKTPKLKNREEHLNKMESLYSMIMDEKKKLRVETLAKCEEVMIKLYRKVKGDECPLPPLSTRTEFEEENSLVKRKSIDLYSLAGESLTQVSSPDVPSNSTRPPNLLLQKPPISEADLKCLQDEIPAQIDDNDKLTLNELNSLRNRLVQQLDKESSTDINTTVRTKPVLAKLSYVTPENPDKKLVKPNCKTPERPVKNAPKVLRDSGDLFQNAFSEIDKTYASKKREKPVKTRDPRLETQRVAFKYNPKPKKPAEAEPQPTPELDMFSPESPDEIDKAPVPPIVNNILLNPTNKYSDRPNIPQFRMDLAVNFIPPRHPFDDPGYNQYHPHPSVQQYRYPIPLVRPYHNYGPEMYNRDPQMNFTNQPRNYQYQHEYHGYNSTNTQRMTYKEYKEMREKNAGLTRNANENDPRLKARQKERAVASPQPCSSGATRPKEKEEVTSPLESLYTSSKAKTGKGYGVQFKITKKTKQETETPCPRDVNTEEPDVDVIEIKKEIPTIDLRSSEEEPNTETINLDETTVPVKKEEEESILGKFFQNLMKSSNKDEKKGALLSLISTFSDSFSNTQLEKITEIIRSDDGIAPNTASTSNSTSSNVDEVAKKETAAPTKTVRYKTELDRLHEDIREMFIRDGVVTATGKRMCRMLATKEAEESKPTKPVESKPTKPVKKSKPEMRELSIVLPKISIEDYEAEKKNSLRKNKSKKPQLDMDLSKLHDKNLHANSRDCQLKCKLCNWHRASGRHYRKEHPYVEVLSSRPSPEMAKLAIEDSLKRDQYKGVENAPRPTSKRKYACIFCSYKTTGNTCFFHNHLVSHTGEYSYKCAFCNTQNPDFDTIREHMLKTHKSEKPPRLTFQRVSNNGIEIYGYLCEECNYVQINETRLKTHVELYHNNAPINVYKIPLNRNVLSDGKVETREVEPEPSAFTCNNTLALEENAKEIEAERLAQMQELNMQLKPRNALDMAEKLRNILENSSKTEPDAEEPCDSTMTQHQTYEKAPSKKVTTSNIKSSVQPKRDKIGNVIEKLQGMLNRETLQPPPLKYYDVKDGTDDVIDVGPIRVIKTGLISYFSCCIPPCVFSTKDRVVFETHCEDDHEKSDEFKTCKLCGYAFDERVLLSAFHHLETHLEVPVLSIPSPTRDTNENADPTLIEDDGNPFPFKITDVVSLAEVPATPSSSKMSVSDWTNNAKRIQITTRVGKKSENALKKFLRAYNDLFKCPEYACLFTTNKRKMFGIHVAMHPNYKENAALCVYCEQPYALVALGEHYEKMHRNCGFACAYCFYRCSLKEYMDVHLCLAHSDQVPAMNAIEACAEFTGSDPNRQEYDCVNNEDSYQCCQKKFLYLDEFISHIEQCGITICERCETNCFTLENLTKHWGEAHNVYRFKCLLCPFGNNHLNIMMMHCVVDHPNLPPDILDRSEIPSTPNLKKLPRARCNFEQLLAELKAPQSAQLDSGIAPSIPKPVDFQAQTSEMQDTDSPDDEPVMVIDEEYDETKRTPQRANKAVDLVGEKLYRCGNCRTASFPDAASFRQHILECKCPGTNKPFRCYHCGKFFKLNGYLLDHLSYHGLARFSCSLCQVKFPHSSQAKNHIRNKHNITAVTIQPISSKNIDTKAVMFIVKPSSNVRTGENDATPATSTASEQIKTVFYSNECDEIPQKSILSYDITCGHCKKFKNKVRSNIVRHLFLHRNDAEFAVPDTAPVNPVPCLEKNEKMFDKMYNLASSSHAGGRMGGATKKVNEENYPMFVPMNRRFRCCASGCNYLCLEEGNLRHHLTALHGEELTFVCVHCKSDLSNAPDVDAILKHLKLHDLHLYKCQCCEYVHNLRHKIERHQLEEHGNSSSVIVVRAMDSEPLEEGAQVSVAANLPSTVAPPPKRWRCLMCKYRMNTEREARNHIKNKHSIECRYKCAFCAFKSNEVDEFPGHFKAEHAENDVDVILSYREVIETNETNSEVDQFDTTPLWLRDKPRVKHIRGILLDESSSSNNATGAAVSTSVKKKAAAVVKTGEVDGLDAASSPQQQSKKRKRSISNVDSLVSSPSKQPSNEGNLHIDGAIFIEGDENNGPVPINSEKKSQSENVLHSLCKYGDTGMPENGSYKCPKCNEYTTTKLAEFVQHLAMEISYNNFSCSKCDLQFVTMDSSKDHCRAAHDSRMDSITQLPSNDSIKRWLKIVVEKQRSYMTKLPLENLPDNIENFLTETSQSVKRPSSNGAASDNPEKRPKLDEYTGLLAKDKYVCVKCEATFDSVPEMEFHGTEKHGGKVPYTVKLTQLSTPPSNVLYRCRRCDKIGPKSSLVTHSKISHPGMDLFIYRYKCGQCNETFEDLKDVHCHLRNCGKAPKYFYNMRHKKISYSLTTLRLFKCPECPHTSRAVNNRNMQSHLKSHWKPIQCNICKGLFRKRTDVTHHHAKQHPNTEPSISERKDMLEKLKKMMKEVNRTSCSISEEEEPAELLVEPVAKKSTCSLAKRDESKDYFSFYGIEKEPWDDFSAVLVRDVPGGAQVTYREFKLNHDVNPVLVLEDCMRGKKS